VSDDINFRLVLNTPKNPETAEKYDLWSLFLGDELLGWNLFEKGLPKKYVFRNLFKRYLEIL